MSPSLPEPHLTFVFEARVEVGEMVEITHEPAERRLLFPILGGTVHGRVEGVVLPGGGDWAVERHGTVTELAARYLIRTDDGAVIDVDNRGFHVADADILARLDAGEDVSEHEYYYRTSPRFHTDSPAHAWMARTIFVGMARSEGAFVCIRFFALD